MVTLSEALDAVMEPMLRPGPRIDRNCLSYWFPKLQAAGVPVPRTEVVDAGDDWFQMIGIHDSPKTHPAERAAADRMIAEVADRIEAAADRLGGFPVFLRTGHFSGKHDWRRACHLTDRAKVADHVAHLVGMSEMFGSFGELPYRIWCVREMLPTNPITTLPEYGGMPLVREVRAFVREGKIVCLHPYWPEKAILEGLRPEGSEPDEGYGYMPQYTPEQQNQAREWYEAGKITMATHGVGGIVSILESVAAAFAGDGAWSVDILETSRGWYVTDMAEARRSFHFEGCPHAESF